MTKILVTYATDYGNTQKMAEAVAQGAGEIEGTEVTLKVASEATKEDMMAADAIVTGSPVHMGSMHWKTKQMIDTVCSKLWMRDLLVGKIGAVFVSGGGFGGAGEGCELAMLSMINNLVELGMIFIPLPKDTPNYAKGGLQWGPYGRSGDESGKPVGVSEESLVVCRHHGMNVARVVVALSNKRLLNP